MTRTPKQRCPQAEPPFVLCGPTETLIAHGVTDRYADVGAAQTALRTGAAPIVAGAVPFDPTAAAALVAPHTVTRTDGLPDWPRDPLPVIRIVAEIPAVTEHRDRVARALTTLRAPDAGLHKVVLARALRLAAEAPVDARMVLARLVAADPAGYGYLVDLSAAGGPYRGTALVGASPELLVERRGDRVTCRPFAGSAARLGDPEADRAAAAALADSGKNRYEHQLVVDNVRAALRPLCDDLQVTPVPQLSRTATLWHLSTPISGRLRDQRTTALDLAVALHPTPAVCGVPTETAASLIAALEADRGFYAGAVGWCDSHGDGAWVVSIRCAQLGADRRSALAHSGGGIVAESDPDDEVAETTTKFGTVLAALGVHP